MVGVVRLWMAPRGVLTTETGRGLAPGHPLRGIVGTDSTVDREAWAWAEEATVAAEEEAVVVQVVQVGEEEASDPQVGDTMAAAGGTTTKVVPEEVATEVVTTHVDLVKSFRFSRFYLLVQ